MTHTPHAKLFTQPSLKQIRHSPSLIQIKQTAEIRRFLLVLNEAEQGSQAQVIPTGY